MSGPAEMTPVQLVEMDSDDSLDGSPGHRHNAFSNNTNDGYNPEQYKMGGSAAPAVGFFYDQFKMWGSAAPAVGVVSCNFDQYKMGGSAAPAPPVFARPNPNLESGADPTRVKKGFNSQNMALPSSSGMQMAPAPGGEFVTGNPVQPGRPRSIASMKANAAARAGADGPSSSSGGFGGGALPSFGPGGGAPAPAPLNTNFDQQQGGMGGGLGSPNRPGRPMPGAFGQQSLPSVGGMDQQPQAFGAGGLPPAGGFGQMPAPPAMDGSYDRSGSNMSPGMSPMSASSPSGPYQDPNQFNPQQFHSGAGGYQQNQGNNVRMGDSMSALQSLANAPLAVPGGNPQQMQYQQQQQMGFQQQQMGGMQNGGMMGGQQGMMQNGGGMGGMQGQNGGGLPTFNQSGQGQTVVQGDMNVQSDSDDSDLDQGERHAREMMLNQADQQHQQGHGDEQVGEGDDMQMGVSSNNMQSFGPAPPPPQPGEGQQGKRPLPPLHTAAAVYLPTDRFGLSLQGRKDFVMNPIPFPDGSRALHARVIRVKEGMAGRMFPTYHLCIKAGPGQDETLLLAAQKQTMKKSMSSYYLITVDPRCFAKNESTYVAKLRSNWSGTDYVLYGEGDNPKKKKSMRGAEHALYDPNSAIREELLAIKFRKPGNAPRSMNVVIPGPQPTNPYERQVYRSKPYTSLADKAGGGKEKKGAAPPPQDDDGIRYMNFQNRTPIWDARRQTFTINFYGRVRQPSSKNFQLVADAESETAVPFVQFGRWTEDCFNLDGMWPFSIIQIFALALSTFDTRVQEALKLTY